MRLIELNSIRIEQNLFDPLKNWLSLHKTRVYRKRFESVIFFDRLEQKYLVSRWEQKHH